MQIDGLIFDIDGTIWDSTGVVADAWSMAIKAYGLDIDLSSKYLSGLFGLPMMTITEKILENVPNKQYSQKEKEELLSLMSEYELDALEKLGAPVYDGLEDVLEKLSKRYSLAVVSNCQAGYAPLMLRKTGFDKYIKIDLCPDDTGKLKADNILIAASRLGMKNPVYVGDTSMDEEATHKAGIPFIHAKYGFGTAKNPEFVIEKPEDLLELFDK